MSPPLPKATCRYCGRSVPVNRNGELRQHQLPIEWRDWVYQEQGRPVRRVTVVTPIRYCSGGGEKP
jgi:hypothetical protein